MVGYFGLIRGEATVDLIARLARRLEGRVIFKFGGVFTTVEQAKFETVLRRCPNVSYSGPYLPQQDLERLDREVDFAWALDLEHTDHNPRWRRPAVSTSRLPWRPLPRRSPLRGRQRHREDTASAGRSTLRSRNRWSALQAATKKEYESIRARLAAVPSSMFVAGEDVAQLCAEACLSQTWR